MTSKTWLFVLILILLVSLGIFLWLTYTIHKLQKRYKALNERRMELLKNKVQEQLDEIKKMHLVGQSQNIFHQWEERWQVVHADEKNIEADFMEITETMNRYAYISHTKEYMDYLDARLQEWEENVHSIEDGLQLLQESEADNSKRVQASLDLLQALTSDIEENPESYGVALPEVQKQLQYVTNTFKEVDDLNENGDPLEAAQRLQKAEKEVNVASVLFKAIPPLNKEIETTFKEQWLDLQEGYQHLVEMQFQFPAELGDISELLSQLKAHIEEAQNALERCDIDIVETQNKRIANEIHELYEGMQKEVDAKNYVDSSRGMIRDFLDHAYKNNRQLSIELDHTAQSYVFHNNEVGRARNFQKEIDSLQSQVNMWEAMLDNHTAIYSEVEEFYRETFNVLEDIENQQVEMDQTMVQMTEDYKKAEAAFEEFEFKMRTYKRYIEKYRLPGLPTEYLDDFFLVSEYIESLGVELAKVRVDILKLNEYVATIREKVANIAMKTNQIVRHARLAEQYMQYANRYRTTHDVTSTINESLQYFKEYRYDEAMNTMKKCLEQIDPESVQKIEDFYDEECDDEVV